MTPFEGLFAQHHFMVSVILLVGLVTCIGIYRRSLIICVAPSFLFLISMVVKEIYLLIWRGVYNAEIAQSVHEWLFVAGFLTTVVLCLLIIYLLKPSGQSDSPGEVDRLKEAGFTRRDVWAHPDDWSEIRALEKKLKEDRIKT